MQYCTTSLPRRVYLINHMGGYRGFARTSNRRFLLRVFWRRRRLPGLSFAFCVLPSLHFSIFGSVCQLFSFHLIFILDFTFHLPLFMLSFFLFSSPSSFSSSSFFPFSSFFHLLHRHHISVYVIFTQSVFIFMTFPLPSSFYLHASSLSYSCLYHLHLISFHHLFVFLVAIIFLFMSSSHILSSSS